MRAVVTGASGFIGRHLVDHLRRRGWDIVAISGISLDADQLERIGRRSPADTFFHLAGVTRAAHPADYYATNVVLTARLLEAISALASPPTVVLIGSAAEYGRVAETDLPVREDKPCFPTTDYAISKYAQTLIGLARAAFGLPLVVARLWNPIGPGLPHHFALASFAHQIAALPPAGGTLQVGNLDVARDFLDVRESVRLIAALACNTSARGQVVNICSGRSYRLRSIVEAMIAKAARPIEIRIERARLRAGETTALFGDTSRLAALGLRPAEPDFAVLIPELLADAHRVATRSRSNSS